ncbi:MAG: PRC-barrel domain-containing protein [Rhizomicrobium sp.]|nr:PRC-barrel domain-containing protein [Rhizomicrobium sp.]
MLDTDLTFRETEELIASSKVEGACIVRSNGERFGTIEHVMIDKKSGQAVFVVVRFGGFLGMGSRFFPIPWAMLRYDEGLGCYELETECETQGVPSGEAVPVRQTALAARAEP